MWAGSTEPGVTPGLARDPALQSAIGVRGERRRHARALTKWWNAKGNDRFPQLSAGETLLGGDIDAATVLVELTDEGARVTNVGARLDEQPVWPDLLLDQILARASAVQAQRGPLGFEADGWDGTSAIALRGILLPLADETGSLRYVQAVLSWKAIAPEADSFTAAVSYAEAMPDASIAWPLRPSEGNVEDRLMVARTWAALAAADPLSRTTSLNAALAALFDATLADPSLAADRGAIDDLFAAFSSSERRRLFFSLGHATRLGLGSGSLSAVLAQYPGGVAAMARLEIQIRKAEQRRAAPGAERLATMQMRLLPIEADWREDDRRSQARELHDATPWRRAVGA